MTNEVWANSFFIIRFFKKEEWNLTLGNTITTFQKESASESIMSWPLCIFFWSVEVIGSLEILLLCKSSRSSSTHLFQSSIQLIQVAFFAAVHSIMNSLESAAHFQMAASISTNLLNKRVWGGENLFFKIQI